MMVAVGVFSVYTITQLQRLTRLQTDVIDRNRMNSLLLLRIQNNLSALDTAMRDMVEPGEPYPLTAWRSQFARIRADLTDAIVREAAVAPGSRTPEENGYLASSATQFWDGLEQVFALAERDAEAARARVRLSLQSRHEALASTVSRLLAQNYNEEQRAASEAEQVYRTVERNAWAFLGGMLLILAGTSFGLVRYNRRVFADVHELSEQRRDLAQQLITAQENTMRSLSRELHDEFGQTLTAVGMALQRAHRSVDGVLRAELHDVHEAVQTMLDRMRGLSHSLHPVILEGMGLEGALESHIPRFESRTGIAVRFVRDTQPVELGRDAAIHVYRVFQEALSNAARHSGATLIEVRLRVERGNVVLEVEDDGRGFEEPSGLGMGVVSMRERAEILGGRVEFSSGRKGGALVRLTAPAAMGVAS